MYTSSLPNITKLFSDMFVEARCGGAGQWASVNVSSSQSVQAPGWPVPSNNRIGIDITIIASPELGN